MTVTGSARLRPEDLEPAARRTMHALQLHRPGLVELARRINAGALPVVVGGTFPLEEGRRAFEAKQGGGVPGTMVLQVARDSLPTLVAARDLGKRRSAQR
jgi:hypothetical protein